MARAIGPMSHTWFVLAIEDIRGVRELMETLSLFLCHSAFQINENE